MKVKDVLPESTFLREYVEARNGQWVVLDHTKTKVLGTHPTKEAADKQLAAIEINKHRGK